MTATPDAGAERFSRIFDVLELLVGHPDGMTLTEIVRRLGMPTSSAHNLLQRMAAVEVIAVGDDHRYSVGARAVRLGIRVVDGLEVRSVARRSLQDLARDTGEDVYLALRLGNRVSYVDRVTGTRPIAVNIRLGQALFLHATAVGKLFAANNDQLRKRMLSSPREALTQHTLVEPDALEAELAAIREVGYSVSREEAVVGIIGYAFPVHNAYGDIVAAIHVSAALSQVDETHESQLVEASFLAAAAIERDLGRDASERAGAQSRNAQPGRPDMQTS